MKTDIEIAQEAVKLPIKEVAESYGIIEDDLELYGKYKAKITVTVAAGKGPPGRKTGFGNCHQPDSGRRGKNHHQHWSGRCFHQTWQEGHDRAA